MQDGNTGLETPSPIPDETPEEQSSLFPEEDGNGEGNEIAQQLTSMTPEVMAAMAAGLDPDVKSNLAQALIASMSPEEKQNIDVVPAQDVNDAMSKASPEKPELMYQMSVVRRQKQCAVQPGMSALADDHLDKWNQRVESLLEDGYVSEKKAADLRKKFDKAGENKFSIILDGHGLLRDAVTTVIALEESRSGMATLSKSLLQNGGRFSAAVPIKRKLEAEDFDEKAAQAAGERLSRYNIN